MGKLKNFEEHSSELNPFNQKEIEFNLEKGKISIKRAMLPSGKIYYFKHKWHDSDEDWITNIFYTKNNIFSMVKKFGELNSKQIIELEEFINFE